MRASLLRGSRCTGADAVAARTPLKCLGEPEDVLGAAFFLASSASAYINGAVITVDGGLTASSLRPGLAPPATMHAGRGDSRREGESPVEWRGV
jgi:hypothetical protein